MLFSFFGFIFSIILLSFLVCLLGIVINSPDYFRICYYALKLPGPSILSTMKDVLRLSITETSISEKTRICFKKMDESPTIFWARPLPMLCVTDAEIAHEVLCNPNSLNRQPGLLRYMRPVLGDSTITAQDLEWKRKRNKMIKGFNPLILNKYFSVFVEKCDILSKSLQKELNQSKSFDFFDYILKTSIDSVVGSTMGVQISCQENSLPSYVHAIKRVTSLISKRLFQIWKYPDFVYSKTNDFIELRDNAKIIWDVAKMILTNRRQARKEKSVQLKNDFENSLLNHILDLNEKQFELTDEQLMAELNDIVFGATETSAIVLSFAFVQLAANKDLQNKVYQEIFDVFGDSNRSVELNDLPQLQYMEMVLKETMRMYPPLPIIGRILSKDIQTVDYLIPKGSNIHLSIFNIHRRAKYWKDPLKFDPERFSIENMKNHYPHAYIPFSAGPRNCIGGKYAMMFMKTVLATLLRKYEFHTNLNLNELKLCFKLSLKLEGGYQMTITQRQKIVD